MPGRAVNRSPKAGGGGGGAAGGLRALAKAAKDTKVFVPATSLAKELPAVTTGKVVQFTHGQRSERKATPYVHGVVPGSYIQPTDIVDVESATLLMWDGVNIFKHFGAQPNVAEELTQMCCSKREGSFSLSGKKMSISDWPRGNGCHEPDDPVKDASRKILSYSSQLHNAFQRNQDFSKYSYEAVDGVSETRN